MVVVRNPPIYIGGFLEDLNVYVRVIPFAVHVWIRHQPIFTPLRYNVTRGCSLLCATENLLHDESKNILFTGGNPIQWNNPDQPSTVKKIAFVTSITMYAYVLQIF